MNIIETVENFAQEMRLFSRKMPQDFEISLILDNNLIEQINSSLNEKISNLHSLVINTNPVIKENNIFKHYYSPICGNIYFISKDENA